MEKYKEEYNHLLQRYYNGCEYLKSHSEEEEKYLNLLLNILEDLNIILEKNKINNTEEILNGFKE